MISIAPSILDADFGRLREAASQVDTADWLHVDVMDGHFVPNLTIGPSVVKALADGLTIPIEVHLMVCRPEKMIGWFVDIGVKRLIAQVEATMHVHRLVDEIRKAGLEAGVALNPGTPVSVLDAVLADLDLVLLMTVDPGYGRQKMIPSTLDKVRVLRAELKRKGLDCHIEVDGGVNEETIVAAVDAGADTLVIGSAIYGTSDPRAAVGRMRILASAETRG